MKQKIISLLQKIECKKDIKILYAVESGSRGWGFESKNSDWDVRFIYIHKLDWYLSLNPQRDSFELMTDNDIDICGWDLKKTLNLFKKSNPVLLEWLRSPIVYTKKYSLTQKLRNISKEYFNPRSCLFHYYHMAEGNYKKYFQNKEVKVKKYFYILRPLLACQWIEHRNTIVPMEFQKLVDSEIINKKLKTEIIKLRDRKLRGDELDIEPRIKIIDDFLAERLDYYKKYTEIVKFDIKIDNKKLDKLFLDTMNEVWIK